ncbi:hypothetical protein FQN55_006523 [Onygenales sp. PD_40]|nr:hypothetical protein FQN55_006523 [Onygenales sp. PD_40]KAK2772314.1 hypothetical protein FQN53_004647 [Emmonsiellopsis sp. PD_33]KAK2807059.1 hypothetical protein FQN51_004673 [Onygenales sp. PD_10]
MHLLSSAALALGFGFARLAAAAPGSGSSALQNILKNTDRSDLYGYPTDLTRGIIPIPAHSHNDYWRDLPFYSALSAGCISVEADVWLYGDELLVGHDQSSLTKSRTLQSLYIDPILDVLHRQNPKSRYIDEETKNGVFDTTPSQTLYLFIDLKTPGNTTWPAVISALAPLREAGYLTSLSNNNTLTQGPVTVIGTGNTPLDQIGPVADRDYFYDAPLAELDTPAYKDITGYISPIASTSFKAAVGEALLGDGEGEQVLNGTQVETLRGQIALARERGIGARYWETPGWPVRERNGVWRALLREGVALVNADDLEAVQGYF